MTRVDNSGELIATGDDWGVEAQPLLLTKLHRPRGAPEHEMRVRLDERLAGHDHRALTLISAPAGYGKTTLASVWLGGLDGPTAWVSLDEHDDDLVTFTSYLVAAARARFPAAVFKTHALLQAPVPPDAAAVARYLANDFEQTGARLVLALDDIHVIRNPAVFDLLGELLRHPLPSLHLMLIGRRDPPLSIASLRARGQVTEIRRATWRLRLQRRRTSSGKCCTGTSLRTSRLNGRKRLKGGSPPCIWPPFRCSNAVRPTSSGPASCQTRSSFRSICWKTCWRECRRPRTMAAPGVAVGSLQRAHVPDGLPVGR